MGIAAQAVEVLGTMFDPDGPAARSIADLWWLLLALGTVVLAAFLVLLGIGLFRRRPHDRGGEGSLETDVADRWIVWGGVAMPVVVLAVVFAITLDVMPDSSPTPPADALVVEVVGHQWWWEVRYPDEGVTVRNELRLPVGRPVELRLSSADVIHSFWVPELAGKMDLLPEDTNVLMLYADRPGSYHSACAEFCGLHHADMVMRVVAEPPERFATWLDEQASGAGGGS